MKFRFEKDLGGGNRVPVVEYFPIAATQTWEIGDVIFLSSGAATIGGDGLVSVLGIAHDNQTAPTTSTLVPVEVAMPGFVYRATADADASSHVLAAKKYDINATTQTVDVGDNSSGCIIILKKVDSTTDVQIMFTEFDLGGVN